MSESTRLSGLTCLVTGASRGIGRATAVALAERGARVLAMARSVDALQSLERDPYPTTSGPVFSPASNAQKKTEADACHFRDAHRPPLQPRGDSLKPGNPRVVTSPNPAAFPSSGA